jgi:hypothetical protein
MEDDDPTMGGNMLNTAAMESHYKIELRRFEEVIEEELATPSVAALLGAELETARRHRDVIKQAIINAMKTARSCVLRYEYIYDEIYNLIDDEEEAWRIENGAYDVLSRGAVKIDEINVYKIYTDPDESIYDVFVVVPFGEELNREQIKILEEIASLFDTKFYDVYAKEGYFYDATPIATHERAEVYTVLHNLVCMWTDCRRVLRQLLEDENGEEP